MGEREYRGYTNYYGSKQNDRRISPGRRVISDLRRANLRFSTDQYYAITVPSIYDIARCVMSFIGKFPCLPLKVVKRISLRLFSY